MKTILCYSYKCRQCGVPVSMLVETGTDKLQAEQKLCRECFDKTQECVYSKDVIDAVEKENVLPIALLHHVMECEACRTDYLILRNLKEGKI